MYYVFSNYFEVDENFDGPELELFQLLPMGKLNCEGKVNDIKDYKNPEYVITSTNQVKDTHIERSLFNEYLNGDNFYVKNKNDFYVIDSESEPIITKDEEVAESMDDEKVHCCHNKFKLYFVPEANLIDFLAIFIK